LFVNNETCQNILNKFFLMSLFFLFQSQNVYAYGRILNESTMLAFESTSIAIHGLNISTGSFNFKIFLFVIFIGFAK